MLTKNNEIFDLAKKNVKKETIFIIQKKKIFVCELPDVYTSNKQTFCPASCL